LVIVTAAPGISAPELSSTTPPNVASPLCPWDDRHSVSINAKTAQNEMKFATRDFFG
jgi:hypothetical protein